MPIAFEVPVDAELTDAGRLSPLFHSLMGVAVDAELLAKARKLMAERMKIQRFPEGIDYVPPPSPGCSVEQRRATEARRKAFEQKAPGWNHHLDVCAIYTRKCGVTVREARRHLPSAAEYLRERTDEPTAVSWPGAIARLLADVGGWLKSGSVFDYNQLAALTAQLWETVNRLRPYIYLLPLPPASSLSESFNRDGARAKQSGSPRQPIGPTADLSNASQKPATLGKEQISWRTRALAVRIDNPQMSIAEIAEFVGVNAGTIYRAGELDPTFKHQMGIGRRGCRTVKGNRDFRTGHIDAEAPKGYNEVDARLDAETGGLEHLKGKRPGSRATKRANPKR